MTYARIYADENGETHIEDVQVEFTARNFAPPASPLHLSPMMDANRVAFMHFPAGWHGDWHPTPRRQYIIFLSGVVEGETSDGDSRSFGPGDVVLLDDTVGRGHQSWVKGDIPAEAVVVQLPD